MQPKDLMTLQEVSNLLNCSMRHLQNLRKEQGFPKPVRIGVTKVVYVKADIDNFILNGGLR